MDTIQPTPRNKLLGLLADAFAAADGYAQQKDPVMPGGKANPPLAMISDLVGVGALGRTLDRASYSYPLTNAGKANVPLIPADTADAAFAVGPVTAAAGKAGKGAGKVASALLEEALTRPIAGSRAAQRGAIRVGGDPSLMPSHSTSTDSLEGTISSNGTMELYSPSIGIKRDSLMHGFGSGGANVRLVPRVGAYDPQNSTSSLFNRDAYTPRRESYNGEILKSVEDRMANIGGAAKHAVGSARSRLEERFSDLPSPEKLKAAESSIGGGHEDTLKRVLEALDGNYPHAIAITDSPAFRSFGQYEKSPLGANLLVKEGSVSMDAAGAEKRRQAFKDLPYLDEQDKHKVMMEATGGWPREVAQDKISDALLQNSSLPRDFLPSELTEGVEKEFQALVPKYYEAGQKLRQGYRSMPSEYAELKVHGPTPVNAENWATAIVDPFIGGDVDEGAQKVLSALMQAGVPPVTPYDALTQLPYGHPMRPYRSNNTFDLADIMQQQAGPARKQPLRPR